jgi:hypothetical protein
MENRSSDYARTMCGLERLAPCWPVSFGGNAGRSCGGMAARVLELVPLLVSPTAQGC